MFIMDISRFLSCSKKLVKGIIIFIACIDLIALFAFFSGSKLYNNETAFIFFLILLIIHSIILLCFTCYAIYCIPHREIFVVSLFITFVIYVMLYSTIANPSFAVPSFWKNLCSEQKEIFGITTGICSMWLAVLAILLSSINEAKDKNKDQAYVEYRVKVKKDNLVEDFIIAIEQMPNQETCKKHKAG